MAVTARTIVSDALEELGVRAAGEDISSPDLIFGLNKLNRILDNWNAERCAVYADAILPFTIVANTQPLTIGPTGDFATTQRPQEIVSASLTISNDVEIGVAVRDVDWWTSLTVPALTSTYPTDLYYSPDWPNGSIYLWPVPTTTYDLELQVRIVLADLGLADTFSLPPGYRDALTLTLAEECGPAFGKQIDGKTTDGARRARARIFAANDRTPRIATWDSGMPGRSGGHFDYRTGLIR